MKWIYTAIITLEIVSVFSLAAAAQTTNRSQNRTTNAPVNTTLSDALSGAANGHDKEQAGVSNGRTDRAKLNASSAMIIERRGRTAAEWADMQRVITPFGNPGYKNGEIDRYGYQGTPLSTNLRPCLVSGARRCVQ